MMAIDHIENCPCFFCTTARFQKMALAQLDLDNKQVKMLNDQYDKELGPAIGEIIKIKRKL